MKDSQSSTSVHKELRHILEDLHLRYRDAEQGQVADYIPELGKARGEWFAVSAVTVSGEVVKFGHHDQSFTIQSAVNPFLYGLALSELGVEEVERRIGVEPSGNPFDSIALDPRNHTPFNPMVNPGAISLVDMIPGNDPTQRLTTVLEAVSRYVGRPVEVDMSVYSSEKATGHRNRAIANLLLNFGHLERPVEEVLNLYFQACSIRVTAPDLATMGATLAHRGINPITGQMAIEPKYLRHVLSVMYTCGMYEIAGHWAHKVGLPAKSGVGGGLVVVAPHLMGVAVFSPRLDSSGAPYRGIQVMQDLSQALGLHMFQV